MGVLIIIGGCMWSCKVHGCGNGKCAHRLTHKVCPLCGMRMVEVTTTGFLFCSNASLICDYEVDAPAKDDVPAEDEYGG